MPFETVVYRLRGTNKEGENYEVHIIDTNTRQDPPLGDQYIEVTGGDDPVILETGDFDDPLQPILATKATIRIRNTQSVNMATFTNPPAFTVNDNGAKRWEVDGFWTDTNIRFFRGYLLLDDIQEPYLPFGQNITLTAIDGLSMLKELEYTNSDSEQVRGKQKIIKFVADCLRKINTVNADINVFINLFEESHALRTADPENCPWDQTYIDSLTFEKEINVFEDCYTVLEKILSSWGCRLFQGNNSWQIVRMDEYKESNALSSRFMVGTRYDYTGLASDSIEEIYEKTIATDTVPRFFINKDALVTIKQPYKSVEKIINYETPIEVPRNSGFIRGDLNIPLGANRYDIDDWTLKRGWPGSPITINTNAFIERTFDAFGYETSREAVIQPPTDADVRSPYLESYEIEVCAGGKFSASVDFRFATEITSGSGYYAIMRIVLHGDDGNWYLLGRDESGNTDTKKWHNTLGWTVFADKGQIFFNWATSEEDTEWQTISYLLEDVPVIPVTGKLYIWLHGMNTNFQVYDDVEIHYSNLQFKYHQKINGQFTRYSGESYKLETVINNRNVRTDELFLFDAPCKPYKGAMFTESGGIHSLTEAWDDQLLANASPDPVGLGPERFAKWQAYSLWQFLRLDRRVFEASFKGLDSGSSDPVTLVHRIHITDVTESTRNRKFICLAMKRNIHTCQWSALIYEIDRTTDPRNYSDPFTFKYLFNG